ncbi:MAG: hypothetical protein QGI24_03525 [Kiritimatiellia bacterium]|jgi:hypothetical protein|nr:hypothetical protein [Kiritimatiellia bacterium]MDP6847834.1 hypothetical protein [Kiritimatiellia bacterium]
MSMNASKGRLAMMTKELSADWHRTLEYWRDEKSRGFQKEYLEDLFCDVDTAVKATDELDSLIARIKKDCE